MEIRHFEDKDIREASRMVYEYWSDELPDNSREIKQVIYEYMVRYYDRNREMSYSAIVDGELMGFLLAFKKLDSNGNKGWLLSELENHSMEERALALEYEIYYGYNGKKTENCFVGNGVMIGLFVSVRKGCGEKLLASLYQKCKQKNISDVYLWTDMSCSYNYYYRNNFEEVDHFTTTDLFDGETLETIIFKKSVNEANKMSG